MFGEGNGFDPSRENKEEVEVMSHLDALRSRFDTKGRSSTNFVDVSGKGEIVLSANATGDRAFYNEEGKYKTKARDRKAYSVDLNTTEKQEFGAVRPEMKKVEEPVGDDESFSFSFDAGRL